MIKEEIIKVLEENVAKKLSDVLDEIDVHQFHYDETDMNILNSLIEAETLIKRSIRKIKLSNKTT